MFDKFQSRKQDYFNWKETFWQLSHKLRRKFQSRKQDYFNWKKSNGKRWMAWFIRVSVPQAGLF